MNEPLVLGTTMLGLLAALLPRARRRVQLSLAKHRSLAGHARIAKLSAAASGSTAPPW
ncbi:MAG: hypothetical protein HXY24_09865 [Rubrivivax sp.]|nr:hypothetical protein [Rubrivivax sp.]